MNRERMAWLVSMILLAVLAFRLPGSFALTDTDYSWVGTLAQVHRQVVNNYVEPVNDDVLKQKAIDGMLGVLDQFTNYIPPAKQDDFERAMGGDFRGVGISLEIDKATGKVLVITPIEGSPAERAGIDAGDIITKVNGEAIADIAKGLDPDPDHTKMLDAVVKKVTGPVGTDVTLTILRDGKETDFTMARQKIDLPTVKGFSRNPDDSWNYWAVNDPKIAYIRITQFDANTFDELHKALEGTSPTPGNQGQPGLLDQGMRGLILDLRFNPGGRLEQAINIVNMFVKKGEVILSTKGRERPEQVYTANGEGVLPNFPMIVLVNELSASAAEIVSGSLKDNQRATIIGVRTYGKGSVQEVMNLDPSAGGGELKLTVAYYYLPSGRLVHRKPGATDWGVEPQIVVPMDEKAQNVVRQSQADNDTIHRHPSTQPATAQAPAPDDQLKQAEATMIGLIVLDKDVPTTVPSTQPAK